MLKRFWFWATGAHRHDWTDWEVSHEFVSERLGRIRRAQQRQCRSCKKWQMHLEEI